MSDSKSAIGRLAALEEPIRRSLYAFIGRVGVPVSREEAGEAVGVSRTLAAYHLDRMVESGLLTTSYSRPEGKTGPGAGRPAKRYELAEGEVAVSIPPRDYEFVADLLAEAAENNRPVEQVAHSRGRELGSTAAREGRGDRLQQALIERGYEPFEEDGVVCLRNCPFHRLAQDHRALVCGMNVSFLNGFLEGLGREDVEGALEPAEGRCCVAIRERNVT